MLRKLIRCSALFALMVMLFASNSIFAEDKKPVENPADEAALEFFEKKVRPILVERCYECHSDKDKDGEPKGGLRVDSRAALLAGGDTGPSILPGNAKESLLVDAINYGEIYEMPPKTKMPAREIAILTKWVQDGAVWPNQGDEKPLAMKRKLDIEQLKSEHWAWSPIRRIAPPRIASDISSKNPIDRFILAKLQAQGISPAAAADKRTLIRRAYFDLIGLPPKPEEVEAFLNDKSPQAFEKIVDSLLKSPHFGERWGRHWLDLVRYAESRGHEFDYNTPNAYQYRDYVIRALNADVPYDQFVVEHIAGDLLENPRTHPRQKFNESILGTGFWFLGEWVHSPVDIRQDEADRFDNMIDVFSKTFLGLTVACARCHDHKFDPITQQDYYGLFGFLQSSAYRQVRFDTYQHNEKIARRLRQLCGRSRPAIAETVAAAQRPVVGKMAAYMLAAREAILLGPQYHQKKDDIVFEDFESGDYKNWTAVGTAFGEKPQRQQTIGKYQGDVEAKGEFFVNSHNIRDKKFGLSGDRHTGTLTSRKFTIDRDFITFLVGGGAHVGETCVLLLIDSKEALSATGQDNNLMSPHRWDVRPYLGKQAQIKIVDKVQGGWGNIGVDHIVFTDDSSPDSPSSPSQFSEAYRQKIGEIAAQRKLNSERLGAWVIHLLSAKNKPGDPMHLFAKLALDKADADRAARIIDEQLKQHYVKIEEFIKNKRALASAKLIVDFANAQEDDWMQDGFSFGEAPSAVGDILLSDDAGQPIAEIAEYAALRRDEALSGLKLAPGVESDAGKLASWPRSGKTVRTRSFEIQAERVYYLVRGAGRAHAVVDSHRLLNGPLHGALLNTWEASSDGRPRWIAQNLKDYQGHRAHIEFSPIDNGALQILMVLQSDQTPGDPLSGPNSLLVKLAEKFATAESGGELTAIAQGYQQLFLQAVDKLRGAKIAEDDRAAGWAKLSNWMLQHPALCSLPLDQQKVEEAEAVQRYAKELRELTAQFQFSSRTAPAMWDGSGEDELLMIRGNPRTTSAPAPRGMLTAIAGEKQKPIELGSGRLSLARQVIAPDNPFTSRVMVNRVWHHLFGRGIVATVDNFGVLGQLPTHPELLDYLSVQFMREGWSTKRLIRSIMLSEAYRMSSKPGDRVAEEKDPENLLLHRMRIRRLEGESIRDSILAISGRLDSAAYGPSVPVYLTDFMQGRGRPKQSGPLDGNGRRSIYIAVRRNFLSPMMLAFDTPIPFNTVGRRNSSNVPAQALMMMNDPFVVQQSQVWAKRLLAEEGLTAPQRIGRLHQDAFSRPATDKETAAALAFLDLQGSELGLDAEAARKDSRVWADLCHVIMNVKEFIFVR